MYKPPLVIVPPEAFQVTAVLVVPLTVAVNCRCWPTDREAVVGDTETDTEVLVDVEPNMEITQVDHREPVCHVTGNELNVVC